MVLAVNTFTETEEEKKRREEEERLKTMQSSIADTVEKNTEEEAVEDEYIFDSETKELLTQYSNYKKQKIESEIENRNNEEYAFDEETIKLLNLYYPDSEKIKDPVYNRYDSLLNKPEKEPSNLELAELGVNLEKTTFRNLYQLFKAGTLTLSNNKSFSDNVKNIERERTDKIYAKMKEKYGTDFKEYQDDMAVVGGRASVALFDPVTFLIPWAKIAKVGKLGATGIGGGIAATDMAIYDYATHGEVNPSNALFAAGLGGASSFAGTLLSNKIYAPKNKEINLGKVQESTEDVIVRSSTTEPPKATLSVKDSEILDEVSLKTITENSPILKEIEQSSRIPQLLREANRAIDIYRDFKKTKKLPAGIKDAEKVLKNNYEAALNFKKKELPKLLDKYSKGQLKIIDGVITKIGKEYEVNQNILTAITQSFTGTLFGGGVGYTLGTFVGEDDEDTLPLTFAMAGAGLGSFHRLINKSPYITDEMKKETSNQIFNNARIGLHNFLKINTSGTLATKNIAHGGENEILGRMMFHIQDGKYKNIIGVEQSADTVMAGFNLRIHETLQKSSLHERRAAFRIIRGLNTEDEIIKSFKLNKAETESVRTLVKNVNTFKQDFGQTYVRAAGIRFDNMPDDAIYGLPQFYNTKMVADPEGFRKTLREAVKIQQKDKDMPAYKIKEKADEIYDSMTGRGIKNLFGEDEIFDGVPYLKNLNLIWKMI